MENKDYELFGKIAARLRDEQGISQTQISTKLGIPQSTYAGYETGKRKVPLYIIKKMTEIFKVSIDYLLTGREDPYFNSTIAAHHDDDDWTDDEREYIAIVKKMLLEKRKY